ncbi:MAG: YIP1 family protein [Terriglobales bacterium]
MSNASDLSAAPEAAAPLSEIERLTSMFFAPSKTFADLKRKTTWATWIAPFLLTAVIGLGYVITVQKKVTFEQVTRNNLSLSPKAQARLEQLPADQQARQMEISVKATRIFSYGFSVVSLIFLTIIAAVLMATFNFGVGAELNFKTSMAIVLYSSVLGIVKSLLAIVTLLAGADPEGFVIQNPVATNPGYFLNPAGSRFLYSLASAVDAVQIWILVVTAIGFAAVSKMSRGTTLTVVFGWYLVFTLLGAGLGALFS